MWTRYTSEFRTATASNCVPLAAYPLRSERPLVDSPDLIPLRCQIKSHVSSMLRDLDVSVSSRYEESVSIQAAAFGFNSAGAVAAVGIYKDTTLKSLADQEQFYDKFGGPGPR